MSLKQEFKKGMACDSVGKPESIFGRAVCLSVHPGKMMLFPFYKWFEKRYKNRYEFARLIFSFDLMLIGAMLALGGVAVFLTLWIPPSFSDNIYFDVTVAPREVVAGASSTLVIRYTNGTAETLRNARLSVTFPDHFDLQEITLDGAPVNAADIALGDIEIGDSGSVRIRGVMFGDVGGEQAFMSSMFFIYGVGKDTPGLKTDTHTFSPVRSTLVLELVLPERLIVFQPVSGTVSYHNTGEIDFPEISIEPDWPEGFEFTSANASLSNGAFVLPAIEAGTQGTLEFEGFLSDVGKEVTFIFYPGFAFGDTRYKQETLVHTAPVIPPQIAVEQSISKSELRPGTTTNVLLTYENTGEFEVTDVEIGVRSQSPFFVEEEYTVGADEYPELKAVAPGARGEISVDISLRSSILQSETDVYENLDIITRPIANYTLGDGSGQRVSTIGAELSVPLTTPIVLESFGRYATSSGDQLGRGPLPPRVGTETKYWVFWNVSGTTNDLENIRIEGELADGVRFTGRQTVSQDSGTIYDPDTNSMIWQSSFVGSTLDPQSKVVAMAFELGLTPTENMVGSIGILLQNIRLTAIDAHTGAIITASGSDVTTELLDDLMAGGKAEVQ